ncbi:MAG: efflux RND transporter periplasmic adaptor subunit [Imperialibacter sp.]|uniref:efflux RND transporter periplasmic adaptor subunit n=1 Tax=Imperialibacter sp. TaxID=2038411 RepID=UPI0032EC9D9A
MKTYQIYILGLALLATVQGCTNQAEPLAESQQAQKTADGLTLSAQQLAKIGLQSKTIEQRTITTSVSANGLLDVPTQHMASVNTFLGSYVKSADKHIGEKVKKGEVLAVMEGPEFVDLQQQYLEHRSQLAVLKSEFERQSNLAADSITSKKNLQLAQAVYEQTASSVEALQQKLSFLHVNMTTLDKGTIARSFTIRAPMDGYLTEVSAKIGSYITPGQSLMEIVDLTHIHAELSVYESEAMNVKEGQKMEIMLPSMPGKVLEADIYLIDKAFDDITRAVKVHGHFEEENIPFIMGMYVEGKIITGEATGYAVPAIAAVFADNNRYVFLEKASGDGAAFMAIDVTEAAEMDGWILLPEGKIPEGFDKVVTKGAGYLLAQWMMAE